MGAVQSGRLSVVRKALRFFPHPAFVELRHPSPGGRREDARSYAAELTYRLQVSSEPKLRVPSLLPPGEGCLSSTKAG